MGKKSLWKDSWRTILKSWPRFLSLFAIIALGAGFFVGIRAAQPGMIDSAAEYYAEQNFQDIHLQSTYGLRSEDIDVLDSIDGIEYTAYRSVDRQDADTAALYRIYPNLNEISEMNQFVVIEGALPSAKNEVAVDYSVVEDNLLGYEIGDTIRLNDLGLVEDEKAPNIDTEEFVISGFVRSPMHVDRTSKGRTNIGKGTIDYFLVGHPDIFQGEYYTAAAIDVLEADEYEAYSDEYEDVIATKLDEFETAFEDRDDAVYLEVQEEAREAIEEGEQELEDARDEISEGEEEIENAREELEAAYEDIENAETELNDVQAELDEQLASIQEGLPEGTSLGDAVTQIITAQNELADYRAEIESAKANLASERANAEARMAQGQEELEVARAEIASAQTELENGRAELAENEAALDTWASELATAEEELNTQRAEFDANKETADAEIAAAKLELEAALSQITLQEQALETAETELKQNLDSLEIWLAEIEAAELALEENKENLTDEEYATEAERIQSNRTTYESARAAYDEQLPVAEAEIEEGRTQLEAAREAYNSGKSELDMQKGELESAENALNNAAIELENSQEELATAQATFEEEKANAEAQFATAEEEIANGQAEIAAAEAEMANAIASLDNAERTIAESEASLNTAEAELDSQLTEISENLPEGVALADLEQFIDDAQAEIDAAREELEEGRETYEDERAQAEEEIEEAEDEIENAKDDIAEGEQELEDARASLAELREANYIIEDRGYFVGYQEYKDNADRIGAVATVFPLIFFLIAALVSYTVMKRMVEEERGNIGTNKALGYSPADISLKFILYAVIAAVLGIVVGVLVGNLTLPKIVIYAYGMMFDFPPAGTNFYAVDIILVVVLIALTTLGPALLTTRKSLEEVPAQLMRPKPPKGGKSILLERWTWFWNKLSFNMKVTFRNLSRFKGRNSMVIVGVAGCTMLLITGFGISNSISGLASRQFDYIQPFDIQVQYQDDATVEDTEAFVEEYSSLDGVDNILNIYTTTYDTVDSSINEQSVSLNILEDDGLYKEFYNFNDAYSGEELDSLPEDGQIYVSRKLSELLGAEAGETIELADNSGEVYEFKIDHIVESYIGHSIYMTQDTFKEVRGVEFVPKNTALIRLSNTDADYQDDLASEMTQEEVVLGTLFIDELQHSFDGTIETLNMVTIILIVAAAILVFIVLYSLISINVSERERELSTLKVLGSTTVDITLYVYREIIFLVLAGIAVGLLAGPLLTGYILKTVEVDMMIFPTDIAPMSYLISLVLALVFSLIVMLIMHFQLRRINMVEAMKAVE